MRTASLWFVSALMLASVRGRALEDAVDDVHVDGHSSAQHDAAHYLVRDDGQVAPDVALPNLGSVRGIVEVSDQLKRPIYSYRGIPFAEAPVGELRFVAPVPKKAWDGVLDATKPGSICIQAPISALTRRRRRGVVEQAFAADEGNQSEDCLVLNVHTPKVNKTAKLPVLVYIHGGAFIVGSASFSTPYGLLDEDVVLVSPQYRLGPIGYLNLQVDEVPGNAGLLDLVEALRWVNKNIEHFGGDPARVTVGGHSAGSASASLLYLSPLTKGLMHAVMPMSGSALAFWAWDHSPKGASESISFLIGCVGDQQAVVACLRSKTAEEIMASATLFTGLSLLSGRLGMSGITPSVQEAPNAVKVMPNDPEAMLTSFDLVALPYYTGVTKHEGTFLLELTDSAYLSPNNKKSDASFLRNDLIHVLLDITGFDDPGAFVADAFMQTYLDPNTLGDFAAMRDGIIDLMAAYAFKSPAQRIVQRNSELGQPSFLYAFNHNGALTQSSPEGIFHGADQPYIFPNGQVFTGDDLNVALTLRKLVVNFVTYHDPTPANSSVAVGGSSLTWPNYDRDLHNYMDMQWPFVSREGFLAELTVARREQFSAGGSTTTVMASSSSSASSAASTSKTALTTTGPTASTTSKTSVTSASPTAPTVSTTSKTAVTSTSSSASSAKTDKNAAAALSLSLAVQVAVAALVLGRVF